MRVTASGLGHAMLCPGAKTLQSTQSTNPGSRRGRWFHEWLEMALREGPEVATETLLHTDEERLRADGFRLRLVEYLLKDEWIAEPAYVFNAKTQAVRYLGDHINREYGRLAPEEIACTADYVSISDGVCSLVEIKTGHTEVPEPERNWQLKLQALAISIHHRVDVVSAQIVHVNENGSTKPMPSALWGQMDLDGFAHEISENMARTDFVGGPHCRYCPVFARCELPAREAVALSDTKEWPTTPARVVELYDRYKAVEAAVRRVKPWMENYIKEHGPIEKPDGTVLSWSRGPDWETCDVVKLVATLREILGPDANLSTLTGSLKKSAEIVAKKNGAVVAQVMGKLRTAGVFVKRKGGEKILETKPE